MALGDIDLQFAWQAWHLWHWAGSGDALGSRPFAALVAAALCVAGVVLGDIDRHFAWQAWHLWHWAGSGDALGSRVPPWSLRHFAWQVWHWVTSTVTLRGRRDIDRHFAGQAWHLVNPHPLSLSLGFQGGTLQYVSYIFRGVLRGGVIVG